MRNFIDMVIEAVISHYPVRLEHLKPFARRLIAAYAYGGVLLNVFQWHTGLFQAADKLHPCQVVFVKDASAVRVAGYGQQIFPLIKEQRSFGKAGKPRVLNAIFVAKRVFSQRMPQKSL